MSRLARAAGLGAVLAIAATLLVGPSADASPNLAHAKAQAERLRRQLASLQVQQSVAIERYDGIQHQHQQSVSVELTDGDQASSLAQNAQNAQDAVVGRARALYMSGGQLSLIATVLSGSNPGDVLERAQTVRSVMGSDSLTAAADQAVALHAQNVAKASTVTREQVAVLRGEAVSSLAEVQRLLARQRTLLHDADRAVVRLAAAEQRAAEARALAEAASSGRAAGVPVPSGDSATLPGTIEGPNLAATTAIAAARSKLGTPYLWGATGPGRFDCSGLMLWSYAQAGVALPRTSRAQYAGLPHVALSDLQPGDLVFYATNTADPGTIHHVAMYLGDGLVVHAPHTGDVVRYAPVAMPGLIGAARPTLAPTR
jgi:cell wall-associated NlpC family hydrolase